jgi:radical SAM superfamily enzyme YgiQ (UPF0313 family)
MKAILFSKMNYLNQEKMMLKTNLKSANNSGKILLTLMPFWSPLTPPLGIACLKSFLEKNGYDVMTVDINIEPDLHDFHNGYLSALKKCIPEEKQGNFYMVGYDVFMNQLMAHINYNDLKSYIELIRILIYNNFFINVDDDQINTLIEIVKDFYSTLESFLEALLKKEQPSIFGVSVYNSTLAPSLFSFRFVKERYPDIITIMGGGIFADQLSFDSLNLQLFVNKTPYIDKIIIGEGEILFLKFLRGELPPDQKVYTIQDNNKQLMDLTTAEIPDFSDFENNSYPLLASYISRSCPFQCSFCSETVQWGNYRKKDVKQAVDELIDLYRKYNRQLFLLGDSLINPIVNELSTELINRDISIYWDAYLRVDKNVCDIENTILWRNGGFYRARLGIESGSQKVLDLMNKKISIEEIKLSITSLAYAGIKTTTYWVLGHPGETEEDFQKTLNLVEELKDSIYEADWHPFFYYPTGQVQSKKWAEENEINLVYPEDMTDMLITQTWELKTEPNREEIYRRVCRFAEHCKKLKIPNPYSLKDIYDADNRWKMLQKNAVPPIVDLNKSDIYVDENKRIKNSIILKKIEKDDGDFNF